MPTYARAEERNKEVTTMTKGGILDCMNSGDPELSTVATDVYYAIRYCQSNCIPAVEVDISDFELLESGLSSSKRYVRAELLDQSVVHLLLEPWGNRVLLIADYPGKAEVTCQHIHELRNAGETI